MLKRICQKRFIYIAVLMVLSLFGLFFFANNADAKALHTLYVAKNGDDANPGTINQPLQTVQAAANVASPGTDIVVRGGTYYSPVEVNKGGTADAYIHFYPYPGETVILDGRNNTQHNENKREALFLINSNYVEVSGFEIKNSSGNGIGIWCSAHDQIIGNMIHDSFYNGILVNCDKLGPSADNIIRANTVYHNVQENALRNTDGGWGQGVEIHLSDNSVETRNIVYENYGEGLGSYQSRGTVISNNTAYDNFSVEIYLDSVSNAVVTGNFVYSKNNPKYYRDKLTSASIQLAIEQYDNGVQLPLSGLTITNNILIGGKFGIFYGNYGLGGGIQNALIANNTIVNSTIADIHIDQDKHSGNLVENNIFYIPSNSNLLIVSGTPSGFAFDYNNGLAVL